MTDADEPLTHDPSEVHEGMGQSFTLDTDGVAHPAPDPNQEAVESEQELAPDAIVAEAFRDAPSYEDVPPPQDWLSPDQAVNKISDLVRTAMAEDGRTMNLNIPASSLLRILDLTDPAVVANPMDFVVHLEGSVHELVLESLEQQAVRLTEAGYTEDASLLWGVVRELAGDKEPYDPIEMSVLSLDAATRNATLDIDAMKLYRKRLRKALKLKTKEL